MFWSKKKCKKEITDPVTRYGRLLADKKSSQVDKKSDGLFQRLFQKGHDAGFVYYED